MRGRYVVAVKGDDLTDAAARAWAVDHASASGAALVSVHVAGAAADPVPPPSARDRPTAAPGGLITLDGPVPKALAGFVDRDDMLVLGTDKTGFLRSRALGVRGVQIASTVRCGVAVIPVADLRFRSGVVAGVDRVETAALVACAAGSEAAARQQPLQIVHSSFADGPSAAPRTASAVLGSAVLERARSAVSRRWPDLVVRTRTTTRPPAEALLDASRNATLLVLGPGASPVDAPFASVIHDVLLNINAPVLVARPGR